MSGAAAFAETAAPAVEAGGYVQYVPVPGWVRHGPLPATPEGAAEDFTDHGVMRILHDTQLSLLEPGLARHARVVVRTLTRAGAWRAANLAGDSTLPRHQPDALQRLSGSVRPLQQPF